MSTLLSLPLELRFMIYECLIPQNTTIEITRPRWRNYLGGFAKALPETTSTTGLDNPALTFFDTCQQIRQEAAQLFFKKNMFYIPPWCRVRSADTFLPSRWWLPLVTSLQVEVKPGSASRILEDLDQFKNWMRNFTSLERFEVMIRFDRHFDGPPKCGGVSAFAQTIKSMFDGVRSEARVILHLSYEGGKKESPYLFHDEDEYCLVTPDLVPQLESHFEILQDPAYNKLAKDDAITPDINSWEDNFWSQ
ncbi:MAG: hypothetical protein M1821_009009 [Bathelium mastoideum]|nr:MAG: hypothetical protein M1821_009009 [Bathelium mastoideum]